MNQRMDLADGRLVQIAQLDFGGARPSQMLAVIHHLVVDAVSWWILLEDVERAYEALRRGRTVELPAKTSSLRQWANSLDAYARSARVERSAEFWAADPGIQPMPRDRADGRNDRASARTVSVELDRASTARLVQDVPAAFRVQVPEVLLAAIRQSARWTSSAPLRVDMEGHGREAIAADIDLLRTVGWFTTVYPVDLPGAAGDEPAAALAAVKECLRTVPTRGLDYGVLRYLHADAGVRRRLASRAPAEILFNYLGQWKQNPASSGRFSFARPIMALNDDSDPRDYLLEINAMVFDGTLRIDLTYSRNLHTRATIEAFADDVHRQLRALLDAKAGDDTAVLTPSDFPSAGLDQQELDALLEEFGGKD